MKNIYVVDDVSGFEALAFRRGMLGFPTKGMVMNPETFAKIFTPERIKLLQRIRRNKINNIYQLAKELKKPYEVVFRNIKYLEGFGLVKFDTKRRHRVPHLAQDIRIEMFPKIAEV